MVTTLREGGRELELRALEAVKQKISNYGDESEILHEETVIGEIDILNATFIHFGEHRDTVTGEFFFRDVQGNPDGCKYFCAVLTLDTEIPLERVPTLSCALSILNFYIETGCFALNKPADLLVYRNTRLFSGDTTEEKLISDCIHEMEQAYEIAAGYSTVVLALSEGSLSLEGFMDLLNTGEG